MVHCYNLAFRGQPLSSQLRLQRGVGWYKFAYGFVVLLRIEHYTGDRSIVTIDHQLQKGKEDEIS